MIKGLGAKYIRDTCMTLIVIGLGLYRPIHVYIGAIGLMIEPLCMLNNQRSVQQNIYHLDPDYFCMVGLYYILICIAYSCDAV